MPGREIVRHNEEAAVRFARLRRESHFEFGVVAGRSNTALDRERRCRRLEGLQIIVRIGRRHRIKQECGSPDIRRQLLEQLQPFAAHRVFHVDEAGGVAAGARQVGHKAASDRIGDVGKYDRNLSAAGAPGKVAVVVVLWDRMRSGCNATRSFAKEASAGDEVAGSGSPSSDRQFAGCCLPTSRARANPRGRPRQRPDLPDRARRRPSARRSAAALPAARPPRQATPPLRLQTV